MMKAVVSSLSATSPYNLALQRGTARPANQRGAKTDFHKCKDVSLHLDVTDNSVISGISPSFVVFGTISSAKWSQEADGFTRQLWDEPPSAADLDAAGIDTGVPIFRCWKTEAILCAGRMLAGFFYVAQPN
jgi:hypothetical protein